MGLGLIFQTALSDRLQSYGSHLMRRKGLPLLVVTMLLAIPAFAHAWKLTVKVTGGSLQPPNTVVLSGGASKTVPEGSVTVYPSAATKITVNTADGYQSKVTLDGLAAPASPFTLSSGSHTVSVSYTAPAPAALTVSQNAGGSLFVLLPNNTWTGTGASGLKAGAQLYYSVAPDTNHTVSAYTINGVTTPVSGVAKGEIVSGYLSLVPGANTISANYLAVPTVSASLSAPTNGYTTQPVNCTVSATSNDTGLLYAFDVTGPASFSRAATSSQTFSFTPELTGSYAVSATVTTANGGTCTTAASQVLVSDYQSYLVSECVSCHSTQSPAIVADYQASKHNNSASSTCTACHTATAPHSIGINAANIDANSFQVKNNNISGMTQGETFCTKCHSDSIVTSFQGSRHPGNDVTCSSCHRNGVHNADFSETACGSCHYDPQGNVPDHPFAIGSTPCYACHDPHDLSALRGTPDTHFNTVTGPGYPASYVTSGSACTDCHNLNSSNFEIRQQWAQSDHADTRGIPWTQEDFKTISGCVQCHTTTGFIAYSSASALQAWGSASDLTKEVLTCVGCHSSVASGALRSRAAVSPDPDDPGYLPEGIGKSGICIGCHSGVKSGKSITARLDAQTDFNNLAFINPHYLAAGGTSYGRAGYHFPGRSYHAQGSHASTGSLDGRGPCLTCHKNSSYGHSFQSGALVLCSSCHGSYLNETTLGADSTSFSSALEVLRAQLAAKGFSYSTNPPGFSGTNWGAGAHGANNMGAAFNYLLFATESGAYVHNPVYARQLILDSIDYLDNAQFDDSVTSLAVANLRDSGAISQAVADSMVSYRSKDSCIICHGGTAASARPMASNAHDTHLSADYGPGFYLGSGLESCQSCHQYGAASHINGSADLSAGPGSACDQCHPGTRPAWGDSRLACTACHAANAALLPNGVAAPYKANFAARGHGQFAASGRCEDCHDPDSRHISGSLGSYTRLRLLNDNNLCAACHNDTAQAVAFGNMSTHFTAQGGEQNMACAACHDPHGSANLSMIRGTINGRSISYTDRSAGLVDLSSNQGICQVCHTETAHFRAGLAESEHPVSGCLGCHMHNAAGGAFRFNGTCATCHGYPPAPRDSVVFGTLNNWSSARFEDYSGGGGVHLVAAHVPKQARPGEGWGNCALCHNQGNTESAPSHKMALPLSSHVGNVTIAVDPRHSFDGGFIVYTGSRLSAPGAPDANGRCFNTDCHMKPSPRTAQYAMECNSCHNMPPADAASARKDPETGAVPGSHLGHASSAVSSCLLCHGPATEGYGTSHRNKAIELSDALGYTRKVDGFLNQTSVPPVSLGSCLTALCHSNGKGVTRATPAWGSAPFRAPEDCGRCHDSPPATGNHPVAGSKHAAYYGTGTGSCGKCHSDHASEANPFGHATSAGQRAVEVILGGGSFVNGQCTNLYCHSNGKGSFAPPTWGAALDCTGCHGNAASTGAQALSGRHGSHLNNASVLGTNYGCAQCHAESVSDDTTVSDYSRHANGSLEISGASVGTPVGGTCANAYCHSDGKGTQKSANWNGGDTLDCKGCHGSDQAPAFASVAGEPNYANTGADQLRANSHRAHVSAPLDCRNCHATTTEDGTSLKAGGAHTDRSIDVVAGNGKSFSFAGGSCSGVSCHTGNGILSGVPPAKWGASLGCDGCHGDSGSLASYAHAKHVSGKGYACDTCHGATVSGSSLIVNRQLHGDGMAEVASFFNATNNTCSTSCHGTSTPDWTDNASGACGSCHRALSGTVNGLIGSNAHARHFTSSYGPGFDPTSAASCAICHLYTSDTAASHVDGSVQLKAGFASNATCTGCHNQSTNWAAGPVSCESCHSTISGPLSVINGLSAPDKTLASSAGHGRAGIGQGCTECHDSASSHIDGVPGSTSRLKSGLTGAANAECNFCHQDPARVSAAYRNMSTHFTVKGGSQAMACDACHDPHGSANLSMIRTTIKGQTISYTDRSTGLVDTANNQGLCQVCHSETAHFKAGVAESSHPVRDCLACHKHNATGGAFRPNGACDACHGYPPAPRNTALAFGTMNNWSSARFEDYTGGGGAHLVATHVAKSADPSQEWAACIKCHNGGAQSHAMALPIKSHRDNVSVSFSGGASFANGVCSNVSCHSDGTTVATGVPSSADVNWLGGAVGCTGCHSSPPSYANGSPKANSHAAHGAYTCNNCHANTSADGVTLTGPQYHANNAYDVNAGGGATFSYTFANTGGTCSNISCHQGGSARWGAQPNHTAVLGSGFILMGLGGEDDYDHSSDTGVTRQCSDCHYASLVTQHANRCSLCHAGANPPVASLGGSWNRTCQQGACHPSFHNNMQIDHNGEFWDASESCDQCHIGLDENGDWPGPPDCSGCHSPASTAALLAVP